MVARGRRTFRDALKDLHAAEAPAGRPTPELSWVY